MSDTMNQDAIRQAFKDRPELAAIYDENAYCLKHFGGESKKYYTAAQINSILTELASLMAERQAVCRWEEVYTTDYYVRTGCGETLDGTMEWNKDNQGAVFCRKCSKRIEVKQ